VRRHHRQNVHAKGVDVILYRDLGAERWYWAEHNQSQRDKNGENWSGLGGDVIVVAGSASSKVASDSVGIFAPPSRAALVNHRYLPSRGQVRLYPVAAGRIQRYVLYRTIKLEFQVHHHHFAVAANRHPARAQVNHTRDGSADRSNVRQKIIECDAHWLWWSEPDNMQGDEVLLTEQLTAGGRLVQGADMVLSAAKNAEVPCEIISCSGNLTQLREKIVTCT
jgi:hypothetical protein